MGRLVKAENSGPENLIMAIVSLAAARMGLVVVLTGTIVLALTVRKLVAVTVRRINRMAGMVPKMVVSVVAIMPLKKLLPKQRRDWTRDYASLVVPLTTGLRTVQSWCLSQHSTAICRVRRPQSPNPNPQPTTS